MLLLVLFPILIICTLGTYPLTLMLLLSHLHQLIVPRLHGLPLILSVLLHLPNLIHVFAFHGDLLLLKDPPLLLPFHLVLLLQLLHVSLELLTHESPLLIVSFLGCFHFGFMSLLCLSFLFLFPLSVFASFDVTLVLQVLNLFLGCLFLGGKLFFVAALHLRYLETMSLVLLLSFLCKFKELTVEFKFTLASMILSRAKRAIGTLNSYTSINLSLSSARLSCLYLLPEIQL